MKSVLSILILLFAIQISAQSAACSDFHRNHCDVKTKSKGKEWQYNAQSKSGLFKQGDVSKLRCVIYKGMDYRISVCCETVIGDKVNYKIFDVRTNEILFDNLKSEGTQVFEFQSATTRQLLIEVTVPKGAAEKSDTKSANSACVGLLIEHRISERQGFSQY